MVIPCRAQIKSLKKNEQLHIPKFMEDEMLKYKHKAILVLASGSHFLQVIEIEWRKKKKNLNYITIADQPTDSRPPEATSASSTNIDRILIFFPYFLTNMKLVHKRCFFFHPPAFKHHKFLTQTVLHSLHVFFLELLGSGCLIKWICG